MPGLRVFPRLDPPLPTPGQYDVELVLQSNAPRRSSCSTPSTRCVAAGWQSGKFLYVDTDLEDRSAAGARSVDREQVADLGLDLASVGQELGTLLGGSLRQPVQLLRPQLQGDPADRRRSPRHGRALLDLKIKTPDGELVPVSTFTRIEPAPPRARRANRFQQRNAVRIFGGVKPGVTKEEGLACSRPLAAAAGRRPDVISTTPGESRQIRHEGSALTRHWLRLVTLHLPRARGAVPQLPRSADRPPELRPARDLGRSLFTFLDLTTINIYRQ